MKQVVTFGEIMGRVEPAKYYRFRQSLPGKLEFTFGGAEANVAASLALFGRPSAFVTALPKHNIADACVGRLRNVGIDTSNIVRTDEGRFGLYFVERGANQRPSNVIYDREYSAVSLCGPGDYSWDGIFSDASWFHVTGITPAISKNAADAALEAVKKAKDKGMTVSSDLNFRKKLWKWEKGTAPKELARKTMAKLLPYVDVLIGNEEDADDVLGIQAGSTDVTSGKLQIGKYPDVARKITELYPNLLYVAITLRESVSASHNNWGAMLYECETDTPHFAPMQGDTYAPYQIKNLVDRVGGGDAFGAGLIFALTDNKLNDVKSALSFAVAASCLCQSIDGDFNYVTREEVEKLASGDASGRVSR